MSENCLRCAQCCRAEIPITLLDIHRISEGRHIPCEDTFNTIVANEKNVGTGIMQMKKNSTEACIFLNGNECSIHSFKPTVCQVFRCEQLEKQPDGSGDSIEARKRLFWESSVASEVTRRYIGENGVTFNALAFKKAMDAIIAHIVTRREQKLAYAMNGQGCALGEVFECASCEHHGQVAKETPLTITDIRHLSNGLHLTLNDIFNRFVNEIQSQYSGGLRLKRNRTCVFFNPRTHCQVASFRPVHCRLTPCAKKYKDVQTYQCLFLGAGTLDEQFAHQVSIAATRQYVEICGTAYHAHHFAETEKIIAHRMTNPDLRQQFETSIAPYRVPGV